MIKMKTKSIYSVKCALHETIKEAIKLQDELECISQNLKNIRKYAKTEKKKWDFPDLTRSGNCIDMSTAPYVALENAFWFYHKRYIENLNIHTKEILSVEYYIENQYRHGFNIGTAYYNGVYLEFTIETMIKNLVYAMVSMLFNHEYYQHENLYTGYLGLLELKKHDVGSILLEKIILFFLQNYKKSNLKKKWKTDFGKEFVTVTEKTQRKVDKIIKKYSAYFNLFKLNYDIYVEGVEYYDNRK